jgi:hypothetical protein
VDISICAHFRHSPSFCTQSADCCKMFSHRMGTHHDFHPVFSRGVAGARGGENARVTAYSGHKLNTISLSSAGGAFARWFLLVVPCRRTDCVLGHQFDLWGSRQCVRSPGPKRPFRLESRLPRWFTSVNCTKTFLLSNLKKLKSSKAKKLILICLTK